MTCIVGLVHSGTIYVGGDSAAADVGMNIRARSDRKIWVDGEFIFGFTGSFRMGQLLRHAFVPPEHDPVLPIDEYMCGPWVTAVQTLFRDSAFGKIENSEQKGGNFIVGYRGRLFEVYSDFQVAEYPDGFTACGSGESYALGAIHAIRAQYADPGTIDPNWLIMRALETAAYFSAGVRAPFCIEQLALQR